MTTYNVIDPNTGSILASYPTISDAEVDTALTSSQQAYRRWRQVSVDERCGLLRRVADAFRADSARLADIITREMGKTTAEARGEVALVADIFDYYADHGAAFAADRELPRGDAVLRLAPIGVLLGIMPWNYPYYQISRFAAPNLALGNTVVVKPAPSCPESALAIAEIFERAGAPGHVYENLFITDEQAGNAIDHPAVQGVSLTGSERAGRAVGERAGRALKKVVLELGGSDPFIVLDDADIDAAVSAAVDGRMSNAGQACTASKRIIVVDAVYAEFLAKFSAAVRRLRVGDPHSANVDLGPLSSQRAADQVRAQVADALDNGASIVVGGDNTGFRGAFVEPTVLAGVTTTACAYREEIFGPVAVVHRASDAVDAVRIANDTPYGLGSVVFGKDPAVIETIVDALDVGMVSINGPSQTRPDLPFGGIKGSGVGRELGPAGMMEFANQKVIRTHPAGA